MKRCFISYFDYLGFKEFIVNNTNDQLVRRMGHVFRDIENALAKGKLLPPKDGIAFADISGTRINSINISDTVIFWTNDTSLESLKELLEVTDRFNWSQTCYHFPIRGAMIVGDVHLVAGATTSQNGAIYNVNCLYGKGLVEAHLKAEDISMASCVIDSGVIAEITGADNVEEYIKEFAVKYMVPYKHPPANQQQEYVFGLTKVSKKLNEIAFKNRKEGIERAFANDNKDVSKQRVQEILANTITFLSHFRENLL